MTPAKQVIIIRKKNMDEHYKLKHTGSLDISGKPVFEPAMLRTTDIYISTHPRGKGVTYC